ncbi:MAG TPA: carbon-nitrogen hydrolase family protein [Chloroflexota bacterium]
MPDDFRRFKAAAVQASPVLPMDRAATLEKAVDIIQEASRNGAQLIVFPETFIPMYPNWSVDLQSPNEWARNLVDLTRNSVEVPGPEIETLGQAAERAGAYVCIGVNERVPRLDGMLYNTLVLIGPDGSLVGRHRKLLPTNREKVFWHRGDGVDVKAVWDTGLGRVGGLICYEHLQPLLKYALMAQGEQIHCACWPGWPNFKNGRTNTHVIDAVSRTYALEGQCFVIASCMYVPEEYGKERSGFGNASWSFFGGSGIINPAGEYIAGPLLGEEGILYAEIDLEKILMRKAAVDTTSRDTRWDILSLKVNDEAFYEPFSR